MMICRVIGDGMTTDGVIGGDATSGGIVGKLSGVIRAAMECAIRIGGLAGSRRCPGVCTACRRVQWGCGVMDCRAL
jgi:hypothetical protein